ncbi:hypothetical protein PUR71_07560 [Streptomyces sp. SP17BM10]|uniref:hypothetical protein n=1 Tax=Streptomyces sp. SP17BM10 TaxID=3002530 RepID=UPI002E79F4D0|nr:hypothetical protein [Streptomyces sp. SP17BM10]MEE1782772.1 hypothetical protein [Streptomyces sp. SP17BM10]
MGRGRAALDEDRLVFADETGSARLCAATEPLITTGISAGPGGVMTVDVGVITGDLTLRTTWNGAQALLDVQYTGADEWYTVENSPVPASDQGSAQAVHEAMIAAMERGGRDPSRRPGLSPALISSTRWSRLCGPLPRVSP